MSFMKKLVTGTILAAAAGIAAAAVYAKANEGPEEELKPYIEVRKKEDAVTFFKRDFAEPTKMLEGLRKEGYRVYNDGSVVEVRYQEADSNLGLTCRISAVLNSEELNNDPSFYANEKDFFVDDTLVHTYGDEKGVSLVLFKKDDLYCILISQLEMSQGAAEAIVRSVA